MGHCQLFVHTAHWPDISCQSWSMFVIQFYLVKRCSNQKSITTFKFTTFRVGEVKGVELA